MANYIASVALKLHDQFSGPAVKAKAAWADLETGAQKAQMAGAKMVDVGKKATIGLTVPIVDVGIAAIKAGVDFNKGLANVASLGVADARVRELGVGVQNMAVQFGQSTTSLNEGLYNVISAFGDTADTQALLAINTKAAAAGMATTSQAIALTSAVTKGYGDTSAAAMQKSADLAFQAVKLGEITFPELAASMGQVVPIASSLGVGQEELFGVMATLTHVTGGAAEVSTQFRGALQAFMAPTKEGAVLISELGFASGKAMVEQLGAVGAVNAMVKAAEQSGTPLQSYIGSIEGQTLALALAGPQADTFSSKMKEMQNSSGALDSAFAAQTGGINEMGFRFEQLKAQVAVSAQNIGQDLMPALGVLLQVAQPIASFIGAVVTNFGKLPKPIQNTVLVLAGVAAAVGPFTLLAGAITSLGGQFMLAIPKAYAFAVAHWAAWGPVALIIIAIAAVVAGIVLMISYWDSIKAFGAKVWDGFIGGIKAAWSWVSQLLNNPFFTAVGLIFAPWVTITVLVVKIIRAHWEPIAAFFTGIGELIVSAANTVGSFLLNVFAPIGNAIVAIWQPVQTFFFGLWSGLLSVLNTVGAWFSEVFTQLATVIIAVWQPVKVFFADLFSPVVAGFRLLDKGWNWLVGGDANTGNVPSNVKKFSAGGYTGPGGVNQVAGVVHAGEYVFSQDAVGRIGLGNLDYLHKNPAPLQFGGGGDIDSRSHRNGTDGGNTHIHIENLTLQAEDIQEVSDFVRMLMVGGAA